MEFVVATFLILYLFLFFYLLIGWTKIQKKHEENEINDSSVYISIICPFRNEKDNLESFLNSIEHQKYSKDKFELILIDDHSEDGSTKFLTSIMNRYESNIYFLSLTEGEMFKKAALEKGIGESKGNLIVTTDCDTLRNEEWLTSITNHYKKEGSDMIIGPVKMKSNGTILHQFQTLDFLSLQLVAAVFAYNKQALLCNGANLAFKKESFEKLNGYDGQKTTSGDDFFLMMKFKEEGMNITFNNNFDGICTTFPVDNTRDFLRQRLRWAGKTKYASDMAFFALGIHNTAISLFLIILPFIELIGHSFPFYTCIFYGVKFIGDWILLRRSSNFFKIDFNFIDMLFSFLCYPFYISYIFMLSISKTPTWKGREIN